MSNPILDQVGVGGTDYDIHDKRGEQLALVDGYYEEMTVGDAEQLVATVGVQDKVPYLFRTSGGSIDIGDREVDKVVGASFLWNQLANPGTGSLNYATKSYDSTTGIITITPTEYKDSVGCYAVVPSALGRVGHKYLYSVDVYPDHDVAFIIGFTPNYGSPVVDAGKWTNIATIGNYSSASFVVYAKTQTAGWTDGTFKYKNVMCIDLTQLFGSTIADYIYSLETGTPGAGVAFFRKLFPKPYYAYNAGSMESVCANLHKMTGFNQWDEQWENGYISVTTGQDTSADNKIRAKNYIPIVPGTAYYKKTPVAFWNCYYDADKNFIGYGDAQQGVFTTPENAHYMRFACEAAYGTTYHNDICINLHWDGERDGEYEPYVAHEYALSPVVLRGVPKLDAGNKLYYDGDTYEADGTVTRRFAEVDLGDLTWTYSTGGSLVLPRFDASLPARAKIVGYWSTNIRVSKKYTPGSNVGQNSNDFSIGITATYVYVTDSDYTDKNSFKTAVEGIKLVYEVETPTTEEATPYQTPQIVDDWGTEEYVDALATAQTSPRDVAIPVGHDTTYRNNLRAKLEMAPESPDGDGDYLLRQTSGQNEYVLLEKELPSLPTEDGTYTLKCTVSGSTKTLTWESDAE